MPGGEGVKQPGKHLPLTIQVAAVHSHGNPSVSSPGDPILSAESYFGVQVGCAVNRPLVMQIWYAIAKPNSRLIRPEAKARRWKNLCPPPTKWKAEARVNVISIIPTIVPTPKTSKYATDHFGSWIIGTTSSATAADPDKPCT